VRLKGADSLEHGVLQVAEELDVELRVAAAHRRDPPEVLPGEQLFLDRPDGTTGQFDLRARQGGGQVGVEGTDIQVRVTKSDGELPQVAQVVVEQAVESPTPSWTSQNLKS
jgi:hypothetical protein